MGTINIAIILPIISGISLLAKMAFGVEIGTEDQDTIANMVLAAIALYGIFKNPKKDNQ